MKMFLRKNIFFIFWVIVLLELIGAVFQIKALSFVMKPLLMPCLIVATLSLARKTAGRKKIIAALFFSFLGDSFLLFQDKNALFFILGLFYFLVTHVFLHRLFYTDWKTWWHACKKVSIHYCRDIIIYCCIIIFIDAGVK